MALQSQRLYGLPNGLTVAPAANIRRKVDPTPVDMALPGTSWTNYIGNTYWIATSQNVSARSTNWQQVSFGGGDVNFNVIRLPNTNADNTQGVIFFGGQPFIRNFGTNDTFVGTLSGNTTLTGNNLVGIGAGALNSATTMTDTTAVGSIAGEAATTASSSTFIGTEAGSRVTTGQRSTFVGSEAGANVTTSNDNVSLGYASLSSLVTGVGNIGIGTQAGIGLTTNDSHNIDIGNNGVPGDNRVIRLGTPGGVHIQTFLAGDVDSEGDLTAGTIVASSGDAAGALGETAFSNVVNVTQGVGALTLLSTNGNAGTNTGFMKFYVNSVAVFVPYFTNIAP